MIKSFTIKNFRGFERLKVAALTKRPGFNIVNGIGITRDADKKTGKEVFKDIEIHFKNSQLTYPSSVETFTSSTPRIGVFILPTHDEFGELEDLCLKTIHEPAMNCVDTFINCVEKINPNPIKKQSKVKLYAWLLTQRPSNFLFGDAISKGLFDFNHSCFNKLMQFI